MDADIVLLNSDTFSGSSPTTRTSACPMISQRRSFRSEPNRASVPTRATSGRLPTSKSSHAPSLVHRSGEPGLAASGQIGALHPRLEYGDSRELA